MAGDVLQFRSVDPALSLSGYYIYILLTYTYLAFSKYVK